MRKWDHIADKQFKNMPKSFQQEWEELREVVRKSEEER